MFFRHFYKSLSDIVIVSGYLILIYLLWDAHLLLPNYSRRLLSLLLNCSIGTITVPVVDGLICLFLKPIHPWTPIASLLMRINCFNSRKSNR